MRALLKHAFFKLFNLSFFLVLAFHLASCGSSSTSNFENTSHRSIPKYMLSQLHNGSWRVSLQVINPDGVVAHEEEATVNQETGEVKSGDFYLPRDLDYWFAIVMYYTPDGFGEVPIGWVAKTQKIYGDYSPVTWTDGEIVVNSANISPDISASVAINFLPGLDTDGDGVSNLDEAIAGSDPLDPNSLPKAPRVKDQVLPESPVNSIDLELTFEDPLGGIQVIPQDTLCGYYDWQATPNADGTELKLKARFNTHALIAENVNSGQVTLSFKAINRLGFAETYSFPFSYTKDDQALRWGPEIAIVTPQAGESVSDIITVEANACDEDGIESLVPLVEGAEDLDILGEHFYGNINASSLGEGIKPLTFTAVAKKDKPIFPARTQFQNNKTVEVKVTSDSEIEIISPAPGTPLRDGIKVEARVKKDLVPDLINLSIESITTNGQENLNFNLLTLDQNNASDIFVGQVTNTSFIDDEINFTINFIATADSRTIRRAVSFKIDNAPNILDFSIKNSDDPINPCLYPGKATVQWKVDNWGPENAVPLEGEDSAKLIQLDGVDKKDENDKWIGEGEEEFDCPYSNSPSHLLETRRIGINSNGVVGRVFASEKTLKYNSIQMLPSSSLSKFYPQTPPVITLKPLNNNVVINPLWQLDLIQTKEDKKEIKVTFQGEGAEIDLGGLIDPNDPNMGLFKFLPRSDYSLVISITNSQGDIMARGNPIKFTTLDEGLTGWWRFKDPSSAKPSSNVGVDDGTQASSIYNLYFPDTFDYGVEEPLPDLIPLGAIFTGGLDNYFNTPFAKAYWGNAGLTVEALVKFAKPDSPVPYLITKNGQFALGYNAQKKLVAQLGIKGNSCGMMNQGFQEPNTATDFVSPLLTISAGWHHIVMTYDNAQVRFYIDGVLDGPVNGNENGLINNNCSLRLGVNFLDPNMVGPFEGTMGEIALYNRSLAAGEVKKLCEQMIPVPTKCQN